MSGMCVPGPLGMGDRSPLDSGTSARWWMAHPTQRNRVANGLDPWPHRSQLIAAPDVKFLFNACLNPQRGLTDADYDVAARTLQIEAAMIQAVAEVESSGNAFDSSGRPAILYERHYFHRLTRGRYDMTHPALSSAHAGGYGGSDSYGKLEIAYGLAPDAALRSVSWGRFQLMGDHFGRMGYASPQHMAAAMARSEREHLQAFVAFIRSDPVLHRALRRRDWVQFARAYNGVGYRSNRYDLRLAEAYRRHGGAQPGPSRHPAPSAGPAVPPQP